MSLVPKEILLSHLQRAEGAEEVTLPIDFFRDLLYQAMPQQRTWVGLTDEDRQKLAAEQHDWEGLCSAVEAKLKEKNT